MFCIKFFTSKDLFHLIVDLEAFVKAMQENQRKSEKEKKDEPEKMDTE